MASSSSPSPSQPKGVDPSTNPKLQRLINQLDQVDSPDQFIQWRSSFLKVYRKHLDPNGVLNAKDANYRLVTRLEDLAKHVHKIKSLIKSRNIDIPQSHVTAQGRRGLTNLAQELQAVTAILETGFMPTKQSDEDRLGYDKFELASTLIEDGFHGHAILLDTQTYLQKVTKQFTDASMVDESFPTIVDRFIARTKTIVDVLEDLGLYKIMVQCVGVVYKDAKKRPKPKKPEPPVEVSDDENESVGRRGGDRPKSDVAVDPSTGQPMQKKKNKKKGKGGVDNESGVDIEGRKGSRTQGPIIEQGPNDRRSNASDGPEGYPRPPRDIEGAEEQEEQKEEEEEEPPPPQDGEGGEAEKLIIFDPKTNMISMISREECGAKSKLLVDVEQEGNEAQYQGLVDDEREKQDIIWLLKKLEKTKPKEESWLEAIKREKAASPGKTRIKGKIQKNLNTPTEPAKKKTSKSSSGRDRKMPSSGAGGGSSNSGFRNPMMEGASSSSSGRKKKSTVEDFQGLYKKAAPKPKSDGWTKIS
mmetsp:Transcript_19197/g.46331  ORF Transcript_19197/g.46331 Transcript_19197/m.46331 type:complete len:528 (+) Transcript_19197:289-1872(+)